MKELSGRVAVVTGGASGIGRALAERFAAEGMKVVIADVEEKVLAKAAEELAEGGATVVPVVTDVSKEASVMALADRAYAELGAVHVLCNNAGVATGGLSWELTEADWQWTLGVNLWGIIHGIRAFVPRMIAGGDDGHVVNTASMAGLLSAPFMGPYNASKFAVVTISEVLHHELAMTGAKVKVSVLCPGFVATQIGESDRNRPDELRDAFQLDPAMEQFRGVFMQMLASGLPPAEVAAMVLDAVRNDRFYILTHPELKEPVRARMEAILDGEAPAFGTFV